MAGLASKNSASIVAGGVFVCGCYSRSSVRVGAQNKLFCITGMDRVGGRTTAFSVFEAEDGICDSSVGGGNGVGVFQGVGRIVWRELCAAILWNGSGGGGIDSGGSGDRRGRNEV